MRAGLAGALVWVVAAMLQGCGGAGAPGGTTGAGAVAPGTSPPTTPGTSASTAPAPGISPNALWSCDFPQAPTDCGLNEQTAEPDRATIVSPGRDGPHAVQLTTQPGDSNIDGSGVYE